MYHICNMSVCAVGTCLNYYRKTKGKGIIYHMFPVCPELGKIWLSKCEREDFVNIKTARICSDHFKPSDYMDDMKNRLLGLTQKRVLKPDAVPSINLRLQDHKEDISNMCPRTKRRRKLKGDKNKLECPTPRKMCKLSTVEISPFRDHEENISNRSEKKKQSSMLQKSKNKIQFVHSKKVCESSSANTVGISLFEDQEHISSKNKREKQRSLLQETKNRLKHLTPKKMCESSTAHTIERNCSFCFKKQKENELILKRIMYLEKELEELEEE